MEDVNAKEKNRGAKMEGEKKKKKKERKKERR